jgi:DNA-binding FadR family transcriptional regulator
VQKTAEIVAGHLRRQIVRGELTEGDALPPEAVLMEQFGVSRPTLREAFRVLESEMLISVRRGAHGGARVHSPNGDVAARYAGLVLEHRGATLADVYEASAIVEPAAAGIVAARRSPGDVRRLREVAEEGDASMADPLALVANQDRFHGLLVELAGNQTLIVVAGMLRHIIDLANASFVAADLDTASARTGRKTQRTHHELVGLVEAGDEEAATDLWRRHIAGGADAVISGAGAKSVLDLLG